MQLSDTDYRASVEEEKCRYENCTDVHDLPDIFHYWSNRYVRPKLEPLGFVDTRGMFRKYLDLHCRIGSKAAHFVSLGSGNCDLEIRLALDLRSQGHEDFVIDCVELNPAMLERGRVAAHAAGIEHRLNPVSADLNTWIPSFEYDAVLACHSLHHVVNLEGLFEGVKRSLRPKGVFLISDMIGRNGHRRWPEALEIVHEFWEKLPPSYRFHRLLQCYDETFENRDCSVEGFEGVRSQDILPLLVDRFHFQVFVGFGNVIDPFVDRGFGPNFDAGAEWDRHFIDEVQRRDEQELESGRLKPTHMMAVVGNEICERIIQAGHQSPRFCVRLPTTVPDAPAVPGTYDWGSWPHPMEMELQVACSRLAESGSVLHRTIDWALRLQSELGALTERSARLQREFEERTEWALSLEKDLARHVDLAVHFRDEFKETSSWALNLEAERIRLEYRLRQREAAIAELEAQLQSRCDWALSIQKELEGQTRQRESLERELKSYLRNPFRFVIRLAGGIGRRLRIGRLKSRSINKPHRGAAETGPIPETVRIGAKPSQ
jgi:SAM-dependent methyltransferase